MGMGKGTGHGTRKGGYGEPDRLLTPAEVAEILGMKLSTVYAWAYQRRVPTVKLGRALRFRQSAIEQFVRQHERRARRAQEDETR